MQKALVTGATSGIGRAIALALRDKGYEVTGIGRQAAALAELGHEGIRALQIDLADAVALDRALDGFAPEVLVNNAGLMPPLAPFCDTDPAEIARTVMVNLTSTLALTRLIAPGMRARGVGHIFFTGSTAAHAPSANFALYAATKAALGAFAQALRQELAPAGVRVTEIVAGRIETALYRDRP